jgi:hypothetical protein
MLLIRVAAGSEQLQLQDFTADPAPAAAPNSQLLLTPAPAAADSTLSQLLTSAADQGC